MLQLFIYFILVSTSRSQYIFTAVEQNSDDELHSLPSIFYHQRQINIYMQKAVL